MLKDIPLENLKGGDKINIEKYFKKSSDHSAGKTSSLIRNICQNRSIDLLGNENLRNIVMDEYPWARPEVSCVFGTGFKFGRSEVEPRKYYSMICLPPILLSLAEQCAREHLLSKIIDIRKHEKE